MTDTVKAEDADQFTARRVDELCDRFEKAWQEGKPPRIEEFLEQVGDAERPVLLRELLKLELEHRLARGEQPELDDYRRRFDESIVVSVFQEQMERFGHEASDPAAETRVITTEERTQSAEESSASTSPCPEGFALLGELGRGGMGVVYRARDLRLKRLVALKAVSIPAGAGAEESQRIRSEAEAVAHLQHANIVQIYGVHEHDHRVYLSLELVDGGSLATRLDGEMLSAREAAELVATLARAIDYAHGRHIIHRDLKPANVLLTEDGTPKITDFGLAKRLDDDSSHTRTGTVMGTPSYMAPEQANGRTGEIGPASDVYALGAILYAILSGRPPFRGETWLETLDQVRSAEPVAPSRWQPQVHRDLETICLKCLQKEPRNRYETAAALADDLERFLAGEPIVARPVSAWERGVKWVRRHPALSGLLAVSVTAAIVLFLLNFRLQDALREAHEQTQLAEQRLDDAVRSVFALQLKQALAASVSDPSHGLQLLTDEQRCPAELRDFTWHFLKRLCQRERLTIEHTGGIRCFAVSPEGNRVATGGEDHTLRIWDLKTGEERFKLTGHEGPVNCVALHPNGRLLATGSEDHTVRLWDAASGKPKGVLRAHADAVNTVAFAPSGNLLASAGADQSIRLWDVDTSKETGTLTGHTASVFCVAFHPDGKTLASGGRDAAVRLWDLADSRPAASLQGHLGWVTSLAFTSDGKTLATASVDRTVKLWDLATRESITTFKGHENLVSSVAVSADAASLVSASYDGTVRLWDSRSGRIRMTLRGHDGRVTSVGLTPDGRSVVSADMGGLLKTWDLGSPVGRAVTFGHERPVTCVACAPDGRTIASGGYGRAVTLWDALTGKQRAVLEGHTAFLTCLAFSPAGNWLASGDGGGVIQLWDWTGDAKGIPLDTGMLSVSDVAFSPDGQRLAVAGGEAGEVILWATDSRTEERRLPRHTAGPSALSFHPRGDTLAVAYDDGTVRICDVASGNVTSTLRPHAQAIRDVVFSPTGDRLYTAGLDGTARIYDLISGDDVATLTGHAGAVYGLSISPEGKTLATAGADRTLRLWDAVTGQERAAFAAHDAPVNSVAFAPRGMLLISVGEDTSARAWHAIGGAP